MQAVWSFDGVTQELLQDTGEPDAEAWALYRAMLRRV